ncbi:MAG TPA: tetratricopeptide repeat protein [Thermoanaerobaculia bacterium]|jgi:tetratricopeptide (TPR) repeat protein|nr:tetratricopeptide repeat protein [Thermoanaerobaculia bacterium]
MNQRVTRKDMKKDEFASAVGRGVEYAEGHVRPIIFGIGGAVVLAVIGFLIYGFVGHRSDAAGDALAAAVKVYSAPLNATEAKPNDPKEPSFVDEAARRAKAKTLFTKVRSDYGHTDAADIAGVYLAQIAMTDGKPEEARKLWSDFVDAHPDSLLAGEARINLIHLDRGKQASKEKLEELAQRLKAMQGQSKPPLPEDVILNELGATYEQLGRKDDATQAYKRILDEFPQSAYRTNAGQRISALDPTKLSNPVSPMTGMYPMGAAGS